MTAFRNPLNAPKLANLPPTIEVFHQSVYLTHTQDMTCKYNLSFDIAF